MRHHVAVEAAADLRHPLGDCHHGPYCRSAAGPGTACALRPESAAASNCLRRRPERALRAWMQPSVQLLPKKPLGRNALEGAATYSGYSGEYSLTEPFGQ